MLVGLAMAARLIPTRARRTALALHEHAALAGLVAIAVHAITLLGDRWLDPGITGIAVPFTTGYRPAFTGLGIAAGYLAAPLGLSFYARRRIGARLWRRLHTLTLLVWALSVAHTLGAGSDAHNPWLLAFVGSTTALIAALAAARLLAARARPARVGRAARPSRDPAHRPRPPLADGRSA